MNNESDVCNLGYTQSSELFELPSCDIPIIGDLSMRYIEISLCGVIFIIEVCLLSLNYKNMLGYPVEDKVDTPTAATSTPVTENSTPKSSPSHSKGKSKQSKVKMALIFLTFIENMLFSIRPIVGILSPIRAYNNIIMGFILHGTCTVIADIITIFIYFEAGILYNSAMKKIDYLKYRGIILLVIGIIQSILFLIGPILVYYGILTELVAFWSIAISIIFSNIPYFCLLGIIIYVKIRNMKTEEYKKLSRQLIISISACTVLAGVVGVIGIISCTVDFDFKWIILEISWSFGILFCGFIFVLMCKSKNKRRMSVKTVITPI